MFRSPIDRMAESPEVRSRIPRSIQKEDFCSKHARWFRGRCIECLAEMAQKQAQPRSIWPEGAEL